METENEGKKLKKKLTVAVFLEIIAVLILAVLFILLNINRADRYQERLSMGNKYLAEMNYEDARICYRNAIRIDQKRAEAYVRLSDVYINQNQYDTARDILELAQKRVSTAENRQTIAVQLTVVEDAREEYESSREDAVSEEKTEEAADSEEAEELTDSLYITGYRFVAKNGWAYVSDQTGLYICENNVIDPAKNIIGNNIANRLMAVDNGVYFGLNGGSLVFYNRETNEQTVVYGGNQYVEPLGITEKYLYFTEMPSADGDMQDVLQMNRENGTIRKFSLPDFCIHSNAAFCGERFFYTKGVADVGTSSLYEVDPETGNTSELEPNTGSQILASGDTLYYIRAAAQGDFSQQQAEMIAWDTSSDERNTLLSGAGSQMYDVICVSGQTVYYSGSGTIGEISDGNVSTVASGTDIYVSGSDEDNFYYRAGQDVYACSKETGETKKVWTLTEERLLGAAYGRITYQTSAGYFWEDLLN
ncbi:MAG: tetratricopeptide repeat protein [Ruminococcus sp.]|jgi:tetratricopeptide (TPR) repeat protein